MNESTDREQDLIVGFAEKMHIHEPGKVIAEKEERRGAFPAGDLQRIAVDHGGDAGKSGGDREVGPRDG
jgi:hypothetical protein